MKDLGRQSNILKADKPHFDRNAVSILMWTDLY